MRRGLTLLEVLVSAGLLTLLTGMALMLLGQAHVAVGEGAARSSLGARMRAHQQLLRRELGNVISASVRLSQPAPGSGVFTAVDYRRIEGFDADLGEPRTSSLRGLRFVLGAGEAWTETPADDDGDGLVDEGQLVLFEDANDDGVLTDDEQVGVVAERVDGSAVGFGVASGGATPQPTDGELFVRLSIQLRLGRFERGLEDQVFSVALRN